MSLILDLPVVAVVFIVRTYAVWKRDKRVGISLGLLFILCQTSVGVILGKWMDAAHRGYHFHSFFFSVLRLRLRVLNPSSSRTKPIFGDLPGMHL